MLRGRLSLHDIDDVEAYCVYLINRQRRGGYAGHDYEDLLAYLIGEVWRLSLRYDKSRGSSFRNFVARYQPVNNWERKHFGRTVWRSPSYTYVRERPTLVPLDDCHDLADPAGALDPATDRLSDLLGIQRAGNGS